jgi:hypothetical protein
LHSHSPPNYEQEPQLNEIDFLEIDLLRPHPIRLTSQHNSSKNDVNYNLMSNQVDFLLNYLNKKNYYFTLEKYNFF